MLKAKTSGGLVSRAVPRHPLKRKLRIFRAHVKTSSRCRTGTEIARSIARNLKPIRTQESPPPPPPKNIHRPLKLNSPFAMLKEHTTSSLISQSLIYIPPASQQSHHTAPTQNQNPQTNSKKTIATQKYRNFLYHRKYIDNLPDISYSEPTRPAVSSLSFS